MGDPDHATVDPSNISPLLDRPTHSGDVVLADESLNSIEQKAADVLV